MNCPRCSTVNPPGVRNCVRCGTGLAETPSGPQPPQHNPAAPPFGGPQYSSHQGGPQGPQATGGESPSPEQGPQAEQPTPSGQQPHEAGPPSPWQPTQPTYSDPYAGQRSNQPGGAAPTPPQPPATYGQESPQPSYGQDQPFYGQTQQQPSYGQGFETTQQIPMGYSSSYEQSGTGSQGAQQPPQQPSPYGTSQPGYDQTQAYPGYGQPPYGAQPSQYGWGPPQRPKGGNRNLYLFGGIGAVVVLGVGAVLILLVSGVFSQKIFDSDQMNADIASQYEETFNEEISVTCPDDQEVTEDETFTCDTNGDVDIIVRVTNDDGDYTWEPDPQSSGSNSEDEN